MKYPFRHDRAFAGRSEPPKAANSARRGDRKPDLLSSLPGLEREVSLVLEGWICDHNYYDARGTPGETKRFRVRVSGPPPGRPEQAASL
jgi:hypothetical protein